MTADVLVLSGLYDFSSDLITLRLEEARVPYVRLNREQLKDHRLSLDPLGAASGNMCRGEVVAEAPLLFATQQAGGGGRHLLVQHSWGEQEPDPIRSLQSIGERFEGED